MYAKIFRQMYDGTLATNGPWEAVVAFQQMLILANDQGEVDMTPAAIARVTTIPLHIIERGISALCATDPDSRTPDEEGRRLVLLSEGRTWGWRVVNYLKYRAIQKEQDRRDYHREYYRAKRAKGVEAKPNSTITTHSTDTEAEAEAEAEEEKQPPKTKESASRKRVACPESVSQQVWEDWLDLRKRKHAPVTETVVAGAIREADKAGMPLEQFLIIWCTRGSQGLQADWIKPVDRGKPVETYRERDQKLAAARVHEMTGGLMGKPLEGDYIDAETTTRRLG